MLDSLVLSNEFLDLGRQKHIEIRIMKLQKLLFLTAAYHLALFELPLLEEPFHASKFGPFLKSVRKEFEADGVEPITHFAYSLNSFSPYKSLEKLKWIVPRIDDKDDKKSYVKELILRVWKGYGELPLPKLGEFVNAPNSPNQQVWHKGRIEPVIPDEIIKAWGLAVLLKN